MARSRNIKPGFFKNEVLPDVDFQGRLLFIGLWTLADREGRLEYRPRRIKGELFPYEDCDVEKYINSLEALRFVKTYDVDGVQYIQILNFDKHQNPHKNEADSIIPAPEEYGASTVQATTKDESTHADSLNPITDSLNPSKPTGKAIAIADIELVLDFLNAKTGKNFQLKNPAGKLTSNALKIRDRLKDGYTAQDCKTVIARKCKEWKDWDGAGNYLTPETLFRKSKFDKYIGECVNEPEKYQ